MPLKVVTGRRLVAESVAPQIDRNEPDRGREPLRQRSEGVPHACRPMDGDDPRLASCPVDDVKRRVFQRDELLPGQGRSGGGLTLEAQDERRSRLGSEFATHDALVTLVRVDGVLHLAERFEGLDEQHVGILTVGIDGDQARQRLEGLTCGPMLDGPSGEGQRPPAEVPARRLLLDVEPVVELRRCCHGQPGYQIAPVQRQSRGRPRCVGPSSDDLHACLEERHVGRDRERDRIPCGLETPPDEGRRPRAHMCQMPAQNREWLVGLGKQQPGQIAPRDLRASQGQVRDQRHGLRPQLQREEPPVGE
jgi:hypothetical protein